MTLKIYYTCPICSVSWYGARIFLPKEELDKEIETKIDDLSLWGDVDRSDILSGQTWVSWEFKDNETLNQVEDLLRKAGYRALSDDEIPR